MKLMRLLLPMMACLTHAAMAVDGGFLFVTFRGEETPMSEQIHFALSADGRAWNALNAGEPVLESKIGEKGVRDPFILRSADGRKFYLLATDLSIHRNHDWSRSVRSGSKSLVIWESDDLIEWSKPRLVKVAPDDAGCTWAPEAVYDEETRDYLVYWASTTRSDKFAKHRIWAARTKDFRNFGKPFIYIEKDTSVIDTDIVRDGATYYRFSKDEHFKAVKLESSAKLMGPWTDQPGFSLSRMQGYEGPQCFLLEPSTTDKPASWCLILDHYAIGAGYKPYVSNDLAGGQFNQAADFSFPFRFRHGSILPVSAEEYQRLEVAYKDKKAAR